MSSCFTDRSDEMDCEQNHILHRLPRLVLWRLKPPFVGFDFHGLIDVAAAAGAEDGGGDDLAGVVGVELEHDERRGECEQVSLGRKRKVRPRDLVSPAEAYL